MKCKSKCKYCSKPFNYYDGQSGGIFCNNKCQMAYRLESEIIPRFEQGKIAERRTLKRCLRRLYGDVCSECSIPNEWNKKPLSLQLDHKDGNSDNNIPSNLRLLCPNCHSQCETTKLRKIKNTKRNNYLRLYKSEKECRN
jgi:hypothetical protein